MDSDNDSDGINILNDLLSDNDKEENESTKTKTITELEYNFLDSISNDKSIDKINDKCDNNQKVNNIGNINEIIGDNIDSSDDEDKRYFEKQKYSEYGRDIKHLLKSNETKKKESFTTYEKDSKSLSVNKNVTLDKGTTNSSFIQNNIYSDPFFGIRVISPLISSKQMKEQMNGKLAITISKIKASISSGLLSNDWVIAGVLISKSPTKTSQKGSSYCIWKLSDLSENMDTITLFLFSSAYKTFWKTTLGTVIGILNPNILESKDNFDQATLSIDTPQKIMIIGKSKDLGKCKSNKKNGEPCNAIVNTNRCEYCVYHVKEEYKKCSNRADLGSNNNIRGFSSDFVKNKSQNNTARIMNSNGMQQQFVPILAKESDKLRTNDQKRLALLSEKQLDKSKFTEKSKEIKKGSISVELQCNQMIKDNDRINKLKAWNSNKQLRMESIPSPSQSKSTINKSLTTTESKEKKTANIGLSALSSPRLGTGCNNGTIDFSEPITKRHIDNAKRNAIKWVQQNGKIKPKDPNKINLTKEERKGIKRPREIDEHKEEKQESKKANNLPNNFKELMEAKSNHVDLIEKSYEKEKEKYFNKLEMIEKMEEKMLSTFKIECKAVRCLICKYTAFSGSELCKKQKHPLRVIDAIKRFFKCSDCGNRTVSLEKLPLFSCTKCNGSNWLQAAMMDERKTDIIKESLSVRGGEEKFLG
ncbi:PREDICTED: protein MCM10 homolog [Polistes dominula]|uniref:Protein MCM10 homolog n=1 Tax=Polistes dominula TaxID=743375 RepID=A0ABM1IWP6_POLDO|nr:PREDICTED: protein MCM10 homolog [Polistes dominula]